MPDSAPTPACCPPGSWPQLMTTTNADLNEENAAPAKGTVESVAVDGMDELPLYVVEPADTPKGIVLVVPDIYSVRYLNPEVRSGDRIGSICDALASEGYKVILVGYFRDQPYDKAVKGPDDGNFVEFDCFNQDGGVAWIKSQSYDKIGPAVSAAVAFAKKSGATKVGVLGFCYGTWAFSKASSEGDIDVDCAVGCHPTTVLEQAVFERDETAMMAALKQPTTILWAGNDSEAYTGEGSNKKAIEATGGTVHEFTDMLHGWVSRGDVAEPAVKAGVESALTIIKDTFASM